MIFPTRNRPENLRRFHSSLKATSHEMPEICVYIDNDDSVSIPVANELGFKYVQGERKPLSQCYNSAATLATGSLFMVGGDDLVFREVGWDYKVTAEFDRSTDKILLVHGDDGSHEELGTHAFIHRKWAETVGYFVPPYYWRGYVDVWLWDIANMLGRRVYLRSVLAEHMHYLVGKAPMDTTYEEAASKPYDIEGLSYEARLSQRLEDTHRLQQQCVS